MKLPHFFRQHWVSLLAAALLIIMLGQMLLAATIDGATTDEQIHIISGYSTITRAHILFDPEHPFLAKAVAALPLLVVRPKVPYDATHLKSYQTSADYNTYGPANQWGLELLFKLGNNAALLLWLARAVIAILTVGLAYVAWRWTTSVWGAAAGLAALIFIAFEPSILAHGHLVNDDTVATLLYLAGIISFYWFLRRPSAKSIIVTGIVFGLGLITKYSLLLLGPVYILLLLAWLWYNRHTALEIALFSRLRRAWLQYALSLCLILAIGWAVIWLSYGTLWLLNPSQNPLFIHNIGLPGWATVIANIAFPAMWLKGAALLFSPILSHGRDGYLLGQCYTGGRWDYFPVITFFKTPLPILLSFFATLIIWASRRIRHQPLGFVPFVLLIPFLIYLGFSMRSDLNIGFRHFLPGYIFMIIIAAYPFGLVDWQKLVANCKWQGARFLNHQSSTDHGPSTKGSLSFTSSCLLLLLLAAMPVIAFRTYPNYLPYFNILVNEPQTIPYISADSNVDWGQGTRQLQAYLQQRHINKIAFDNFDGTAEAIYDHLPLVTITPADHTYKGYLALSRSTIIDHICKQNNDWGWVIDHHQPVAIIGNAINLYDIQ